MCVSWCRPSSHVCPTCGPACSDRACQGQRTGSSFGARDAPSREAGVCTSAPAALGARSHANVSDAKEPSEAMATWLQKLRNSCSRLSCGSSRLAKAAIQTKVLQIAATPQSTSARRHCTRRERPACWNIFFKLFDYFIAARKACRGLMLRRAPPPMQDVACGASLHTLHACSASSRSARRPCMQLLYSALGACAGCMRMNRPKNSPTAPQSTSLHTTSTGHRTGNQDHVRWP